MQENTQPLTETKPLWQPKEMLIFLLVAFGLPFLMGVPLAIAQRAGSNTDVYPSAQMFYPAAGVMLAYLFTRRAALPRLFYGMYLVCTAALVACCIGAVAAPGDVWLAAVNAVMIVGSVLSWVFLLVAKKDRRAAAGLRWQGGVKALGYVALFLLLRTAAVFISLVPYGQLGEYLSYWTTLAPYSIILLLIPNFFLSFLAFFGEEYGWRYYWQPRMQQRFGPRAGVVLLCLAWALWHLPLNLFYYAPETGLQSFVSQIVTCLCLGIFFAWAYQKTQNIWVAVLLHYFNNNMILAYTGSAVISNQTVTWFDILIQAVVYGALFLPFFASKVFNTHPRAAACPLQHRQQSAPAPAVSGRRRGALSRWESGLTAQRRCAGRPGRCPRPAGAPAARCPGRWW